MNLVFAILCSLILLVAASPASQADAVSTKTANQYFQSCMAHDDPRMSDSAQESLCGCTSAQMTLMLTSEDITAMSPAPGTPGRIAYDKMLIQAYGPCMQIPVEENFYEGCMKDGNIQKFALKDPGKLCHCLAVKTTEKLPIEAQSIVESALKKTPDLTDPYDAIAYNPDLRAKALDNLTLCLHEGN